jgi:hypothetical protein
MRVRIQGVIYDTLETAATAFNVTEQTIRRALCEDREARLKVRPADCKRGRPQPFTIEGITWPNQKAANTALGLSFNYITQAVNRNSAASLAKVAAAARAYKKKINLEEK